jgi:purine-binding chemotaxis protein CheW
MAQVTAARGLPVAVELPAAAPVADGGWLAPIIEPGTHLEDIERHETNVLLDFDADLLPSAGEQPRNVPGQGSGESICTFWLGPDCFGLGVQLVSEVLLVDDILPVPWAPPALLGLINSRGRIVPVVSLATLLGVASAGSEPMAASQPSPAILIKADSLLAAALVDRPGLVVQLDRAGVIPTEPGSAEPWVKGHLRPEDRTQPAITLLDAERLVQRFLDVSRFPDIRACLASGGHRPRAASAQHRGVTIS